LPQGAAQRRLADSQPVGGIGKMAQLGQGNKVLKLFKRARAGAARVRSSYSSLRVVLQNNPSLSGDKFIHLGKRLLCP
jgi:hypothetical protein